jgi:hypothetical protein
LRVLRAHDGDECADVKPIGSTEPIARRVVT